MSDAGLEHLKRLAARSKSDCERGVPFEDGLAHFTEFILKAVEEIDKRIEIIKDLTKRK